MNAITDKAPRYYKKKITTTEGPLVEAKKKI